MNIRAAAVAATAALALAALGAGPAFADNHISVVPQGQDGTFGEQGPQYFQSEQGAQYRYGQEGAPEHLSPQRAVVGDLATN
ncbi:hypothetical protein [Streptomyces sp. H34-S4]|uniref:hypothetical protein n=1 Tax=Streptomyces sp. H34-S4 TaxID=2996463 RepID=UPI00226D9C56|nr:hypothetical protein [Streptomyces sp. H34-S4]MCY0937114.1 hypothetical protein [Streptomyces sp. H34-S4]